jgi:hypothetical protein
MKKERCPSGSTRSADVKARYDLVSPFGLRRLALRYGLGAAVHGDHNWRRGQPYSVVVKHMMEHLALFMQGDDTDDNMAAIAWGAFAIMEYDTLGRTDLDDRYVFKRGVQARPQNKRRKPK